MMAKKRERKKKTPTQAHSRGPNWFRRFADCRGRVEGRTWALEDRGEEAKGD